MADELKPDDVITPTPGAKGGDETTVTMTQAKLDDLINGKFKKGAEKATTDLLATLGAENIESVKAILDKQKETEDANKTEL